MHMREDGFLPDEEVQEIRHTPEKRSVFFPGDRERLVVETYQNGPPLAESYRAALEDDHRTIESRYQPSAWKDERLKHNEQLLARVDGISDHAVLAALSRPSSRFTRAENALLLRRSQGGRGSGEESALKMNDDIFASAIEKAGGPVELAKQLHHLTQFTDVGWKVRPKGYTERHIDEGVILALLKLAREYPETQEIGERTIQNILFEQSGWAFDHLIDVGVPGAFDEGLEELKSENYVEYHQMAGPVMRDAIWALGEIGTEQSIGYLKQWMKHESPDYIPSIAWAVQKIDITKAAQEFLPELRGDDRFMRRAAQYILKRLEFGRIGMSEGAVNYLDRQYRIEGEGSDGDVVQRLTPDGKIGVFKGDRLVGYFPLDFESQSREVSARLSPVAYHDLFLERHDLSDEEVGLRERTAREYGEKVLEHFEHPLFRESGVALNNFSLQEQGWILAFLQSADAPQLAELHDFVKQYQEPGLRSFITMEFGQARASHILELAHTLPATRAEQLFERFSSYVEVNRARVPDIHARLQEAFPDVSVSVAELEEAIVHRAAELIETVYAQTYDADNKDEIVGKLLADFSRESDVESFLTSRLYKISEVFEREDINLRKFEGEQRALLEAIDNSGFRGILVRALGERTHLEPIPRVYWEVDRTSEKYSERFGFDVRRLLEIIRIPEGEKGLIVEFGPGSGMAKAERSPIIRDTFVDVGVADRLYYPLNTIIENLIDFNALEKEVGAPLSPDERQRLADVVYKVLVIQPGQEAQDSFDHNDELLQRIARDPEELRTALAGLGERLASVSVVPETRCQKDANGRIVHKDKIRDEDQSENWRAAKEAFAARPEGFMRDADIYTAIPVHTPGIAFGDFADVDRLANGQIDVALAIRSTVYKEGEAYDTFLHSTAKKMKPDGIWLDDSIRENGGAGYRLGAHLRFAADQREAGRHEETFVILGPGMQGEDPYRDGPVPLSFVRTANNRARIFMAEHLRPGFQMMEIEQLCSGEYDEWIRALDPSGKTLADLERARAEIRDRRRSTGVQTESESSEQFPRAA